ncbi:hypothetical protein FACS1894190_06910 [Spirochaetia bacterium]|nr:hypothetical protein FACS1894190_06910 [Spirochaetia bacterium]
MADIFVPGVKNRFDTEKIISGLMEIQKIPKNRIEGANTALEKEKTGWQDLGRRISSVRENARLMYSYQNPFNDRAAVSSNDSVLSGTTTREAAIAEHSFTVKQIARPDRFSSDPLDKNYRVPAGSYGFSTGKAEFAVQFSGGTLQQFAEAVNRRADGKLKISTLAVQSDTRSLIVESQATGEQNKLTFSGAARDLAIDTGIIGHGGEPVPKTIKIKDELLRVNPLGSAAVPIKDGAATGIKPTDTMIIRFETAFSGIDAGLQTGAPVSDAGGAGQAGGQNAAGTAAVNNVEQADASGALNADAPPPEKPDITAPEGAVTDGKYAYQTERSVTTNSGSAVLQGVPAPLSAEQLAQIQEEAAAAAEQTQAAQTAEALPVKEAESSNLGVLSLVFSDGTSAPLPAINPGSEFTREQYQVYAFSGDKTVTALRIDNSNAKGEVSIRNIEIFDPKGANTGTGAEKPLHPLSVAQDAVLEIDGIEITRASNDIDDLVPGLNITAHAVSDKPVSLNVQTDTEVVKDALITMVGSYNRLMAELNVLTRADEGIVNELTYLSADEQKTLREKLGLFSGDTTLARFRSVLQQIVSASYTTNSGDSFLLSAFGISTDARRSGSYDPSKLRGYLEIDEKVLDNALQTRLGEVSSVFGRDTDGDLIIDSGVAYAIDKAAQPYVELGGIIATKTGTIDSRLASNSRRIETLDRQLATKEQTLKNQYGQLEGAYNRMERMSNSLDQFGQQTKK